jgi:hypothetical protein
LKIRLYSHGLYKPTDGRRYGRWRGDPIGASPRRPDRTGMYVPIANKDAFFAIPKVIYGKTTLFQNIQKIFQEHLDRLSSSKRRKTS